MEIPVTAIADSIKRGDILLSEFDGIDHRKFFVEMVKASKVISERHKKMFFE